ncbi:hypothetical protein CPAR01_11705 [Colletotrichum paranaense]|nr:uncharacterized protein CPAR01_11705 [Colletotrichum paranaense]KAK1469501.1 hypothetical protein CMEL01_01268 [Colletotrichum melonis]KAK1529393.1 hypothetical protein CPAR01_11705 [Colletotrichum paranaense]
MVGEGNTPSLVVDGYSQQYVSLPPDEGAQGFPGVMAKALLVSRTRMRKKTGPGDCLVSHVPLDPFRQSGSFTQAVNGWRGSESSVEQVYQLKVPAFRSGFGASLPVSLRKLQCSFDLM